MKTFVLREDRNAQALWAYLKQAWRAASDAGHPLVVEIRQERSAKSRAQEKRHWARMRYVSEYFQPEGQQTSAEAWHAYFCGEVIGHRETLKGRELTYISSTALNSAEYSVFEEQIDAILAGFGFSIPEIEDL